MFKGRGHAIDLLFFDGIRFFQQKSASDHFAGARKMVFRVISRLLTGLEMIVVL